jgi:uncharacterized protein YyaL (SSP411 family)
MANRLAGEQSPYLLQHKDNPVDWYPWGPDAFARAKDQDKPVFLSIGYSTCHWCHVMAHESFENEGIAGILNRDFVPIKVDREERPDVDDVYMAAVQAMTGTGGWPLSLFLTPDGRPFFGGTYYPPDDRYGRPGFATLLTSIASAWRNNREQLEGSAAELLAHLSETARISGGGPVSAGVLDSAAHALEARFDRAHGGFGQAPKFPPSMNLEFLLRRWIRMRRPLAREVVETTLSKMAAGGIYDQVGGGFHRYSVDDRWLVPHFEKMLYDNAMLARVYLLAARTFGVRAYARIARETLDFLRREMEPPEGGFFAAQDADSEEREGAFYVWDPESIAAAVGSENAELVCARFGVDEHGNFEEGQSVLAISATVPDLAGRFGRTDEEVGRVLIEGRRRLFEARSRRVRPGTDRKLLTDWSALAISAFALAARVLREPAYEASARRAADRILETCRRDGALLHRPAGAGEGIPGFASDHAAFIEALLDLYEATFEARYFSAAVELQRRMDEKFSDPEGGYYLSQAGHDGLIVRPRESLDGAMPASNSVAAMNLLRLASFTGEGSWRERARRIFEVSSPYLNRAPIAVPRLLCALDFAEDSPREIVLSGTPGDPDFESLRDAVFESARLNRIVAHAGDGGAPAELSGLLASRSPSERSPAAYVCENFACRSPTSDPAELRAMIDGEKRS